LYLELGWTLCKGIFIYFRHVNLLFLLHELRTVWYTREVVHALHVCSPQVACFWFWICFCFSSILLGDINMELCHVVVVLSYRCKCSLSFLSVKLYSHFYRVVTSLQCSWCTVEMCINWDVECYCIVRTERQCTLDCLMWAVVLIRVYFRGRS
jgi:hypothetical protein